MDLNELQSVQSRERQTDSLQQLRASFYRDAADYIGDLESERDAAADRADDPWNSPEVGRLNDDIDTAKDTVEAIYERRVGKIVKIASLAAADMPTDDEGLTDEEQVLFDRLVAAIEQNREGVFAILDGEDPPVDPTTPGPANTGTAAEPADPRTAADPGPEADAAPSTDAHPTSTDTSTPPAEGATSPAGSTQSPPETPDGTGGERQEVPPDPGVPADDSTDERSVGAADLMGGDSGAEDGKSSDTGAEPRATDTAPDRPDRTEGSDQPVRDGGAVDAQSGDATGGAEEPQSPPTDEASDVATDTGESTTVDRSMVRITDDVGPIYGVEGREYDLTANDVVTLPEANVGPLLEQGAAERLD